MQQIRKAIIPAAGLGTRFLPFTKVVPKELLPLGAFPALHYVVAEARASGIDTIILVTSKNKGSLADYFQSDPQLLEKVRGTGAGDMLESLEQLCRGLKVQTIEQKVPRGLGDAVRVGSQLLEKADEHFAVILPDDILLHSEPNLKLMIELQSKTGSGVVGLQQVPKKNISSYGVVRVEPWSIDSQNHHKITALVEKPPANEAPSNLAVVGRYLFPRAIVPILETLPPGRNQEIQLTDAMNLLTAKQPMLGFELRGERLDVGTPQGLLEANLTLALEQGSLSRHFIESLLQRLPAAERLG